MTRRKIASTIASARLIAKGKMTLPLSIREKLNLRPGDTVVFEESRGGSVSLRKAEPSDVEFLSSLENTLSEWNSQNDERAYRDL
jgi:antitoxin PrlF